MTNTDELTTGVETIQNGIVDTKGQAGQALNCAEDLTNSAAAHGWQGVAASTQAAVDALEAVIASLDTAEQATQAASGVLREITDQMSNAEVAGHLANTVTELDTAGGALGGH